MLSNQSQYPVLLAFCRTTSLEKTSLQLLGLATVRGLVEAVNRNAELTSMDNSARKKRHRLLVLFCRRAS